MSRLTCRLSGVAYVPNSDTSSPANFPSVIRLFRGTLRHVGASDGAIRLGVLSNPETVDTAHVSTKQSGRGEWSCASMSDVRQTIRFVRLASEDAGDQIA